MKKAFDQNVSRTKPRLRLGSALAEVMPSETEFARAVMAPAATPVVPVPDLGSQVKARAERAREPKVSATEAVQRALDGVLPAEPERAYRPEPPMVSRFVGPVAQREAAEAPAFSAPVAHAAAPATVTEVQTPAAPSPSHEPQLDPAARRERLKERLQAVRENPRPEPLPPTVAEAGVLAVERIAILQAELSKVKVLNLALTQDLESARRQSERATEEARLRMDEARRLSSEMEERAKLLSELERELSSLEGERDEALLSLQESRQTLEAGDRERDTLKADIAKRDQSLAESLSEEERLASELESAHDDATALRRSLDALKTERDTFARQVSDLTIERADLLEARKALQAVHKALSHAVAR
ncbi:MAG: extensin-like protein [Myxococcaceae bacterium]